MSRSLVLHAVVLVVACWGGPTSAQSVCLPLPRLLTIMPMGGTVGGQVEVAVTGERIEGGTELRFSHPGIVAVRTTGADGSAVPDAFVVTIGADVPPGVHEAAMVTPMGVSSPRTFTVGTLPEAVRTIANASLDTAMPLAIGSVCNAVATAQAVDHYRFEAHRGQRVVLECATRGIESRLEPVLVVADAKGRDLVVERRGGTIDFTVPEDAAYVVKVHDLSFQGGPAFFYRLVVSEIPAGAAVPRQAAVRGVSAFSWPPAGLPERAAIQEVEPNDAVGQEVGLPCDVAGVLLEAADVDSYEFEAKQGDVWWIEVASQRLGAPTDVTAVVQRVGGPGAGGQAEDVAELNDIPSPLRPSTNHYAYDGPPYDAGSADILGRVDITQTGRHRIRIRDLFGGTRKEPRSAYRLVVRQAMPDFALVGWALHRELRNGDRNDLSKPPALRPGSTVAFEVVALRRDGFDDDISLGVEGLPPGVTAAGITIPKGAGRGLVLLTAAEDAQACSAPLRIVGRATVGGAEVVRPCAIASVAWPVRDHWQEIPLPRLVADPIVSVGTAETAPLTIAPADGKASIDAVAGTSLTLPLRLVRRSEFSGGLLQVRAFGQRFDGMPVFDVPLTGDTHEVVLDLEKLKIPPGEHTIAFCGTAIVKYRPAAKPGADPPAPVDTAEIVISTPLRIRVAPRQDTKPAEAAAPGTGGNPS